MFRKFIIIISGLMVLSFAGKALAQDAKALFEEGNVLFADGDFKEASKKFREAYAAKPSWKLFYNIAHSEAAAKRYGLALDAFELYLANAGDEISVERQTEVRDEAKRLRDMVGTVEPKAPKGAVVEIDGMERGIAPILGGVLVTAGKRHTVVAIVDGVEIASTEFKVRVGATLEVDLTGAEDSGDDIGEDFVDTSSGQEKLDSGGPNKLAVAGIVTSGIGVAALVGGAVSGGLALGKDKDLKDQCDGVCDISLQPTIDTRDKLSMTSTILIGVGAAAVTAGVVLLVVGRKQEKAVAFAPAVGPRIAGANLSLMF